MRLYEVVLKNYGPFAEARLSFHPDRPIGFLLGENGRGKTMVARAIEMGLRGDVHALRGARLSLANFIGPNLTVPAEITLTIAREKPLVIGRRITGKGMGATVGGREATKAIYDYFCPPSMKSPDHVWRTICNVSGFFDLPEADQKTLLMGLVDQSIPADKLPSEADMKERVTPPKHLGDVARAYDEAFAGRRQAKKHLADLRLPPEPEEAEEIDLKEIRDKLALLRANESALVKAVGHAGGQREALATQLDELVSKDSVYRGQLQTLGTLEDAEKAVGVARARLDAAKAENEQAVGRGNDRREKEDRLAKIKTASASLGQLGATCVISSDVGCPLSATKREEAQAAWKRSIAKLEGDLAQLPMIAVQDVRPLEQAIREAEKKVEAIKDITGRLNAVTKDAEALRKRIEGLPVEQDNPDLQSLRARIALGEKNLAEAVGINDALRERRRLEGELAKRQADVEAYERLCVQLGAKGLIEDLLGARLGAVLGALNERMAAFGLKLALHTEPWAITINGRHPLMISASQRFRAGVALQFALADLTGARWALVDGLDVLDKDNRGAFFDLAETAIERSWCEQILVTATVTDKSVYDVQWPPPYQAFRIEGTEFGADSTVVPLGSAA